MPIILQPRRRVEGIMAAPAVLHAAGLASASSQKLSVPANSHLQIPAATDMTLSVWAFPTAGTTYRGVAGMVTGTGPASADNYGIQLANDGGGNYWSWFISDGTNYQAIGAVGVSDVTLNAWNFICGTYDHTAGVMTIQINGGQSFVTRTGGSVNTANLPFQIGCQGSTRFFDGRIDDVNLFTRVLNSTDQNLLYAGGASLRADGISGSLDTGHTAGWDLDGPYGDGLWHDVKGFSHLTPAGGVTVVTGIS